MQQIQRFRSNITSDRCHVISDCKPYVADANVCSYRLMANQTHSSSGQSQRFEWNLLACKQWFTRVVVYICLELSCYLTTLHLHGCASTSCRTVLIFDHSRQRERDGRTGVTTSKHRKPITTELAAKQVAKFELCLLDSPEGSDF